MAGEEDMKSEEQMKEDMRVYRELEWWEHYPLHKLWCNDLCPIVPRIRTRKADKYNSYSWGVHWLLLHVWSMDHFSFGIDADISMSNVCVGAILPYLRIRIGISHFYNSWTWKIDRFLSRAPTERYDF